MSVHKLNPEHPLVQGSDEQWFKIAAILLWKSGKKEITVTVNDIREFSKLFGGEMPTVVMDGRSNDDNSITLRLVRESEAKVLLDEWQKS